jgi:hypothetical protein
MSNYLVLVLDRFGVLQEKNGKEMRQLFPKHQDAERWAQRRLIEDSQPGAVALIQATRMMSKSGEPLTIRLTREECFAKQFPKPKTPSMKTTLSKNAPLTFRWVMRPTRVSFSHG